MFSEKTIMNVRSLYRNDGARKYEEVENGLNKMTVGKFEELISKIDMKTQYKKYECVKGMNIIGN